MTKMPVRCSALWTFLASSTLLRVVVLFVCFLMFLFLLCTIWCCPAHKRLGSCDLRVIFVQPSSRELLWGLEIHIVIYKGGLHKDILQNLALCKSRWRKYAPKLRYGTKRFSAKPEYLQACSCGLNISMRGTVQKVYRIWSKYSNYKMNGCVVSRRVDVDRVSLLISYDVLKLVGRYRNTAVWEMWKFRIHVKTLQTCWSDPAAFKKLW